MPVIDVQVHPFDKNHPGRPWAGPSHGLLSATGEEMVAAMTSVGVDGAIMVSSFSAYEYDPSYALEVYNKYPDKFRVVTPVDATDPAIDDVVAKWAKTPGARGIRLRMGKGLPMDADHPGLRRAFAAAARHGLPVNLLCWGILDKGLPHIRQHPDTVIVIDHLGLLQPFRPPVPADVWADLPKLLDLARFPNVRVKVSGACTMSHQPFPYDDIWEPVLRIIDAFGLDRCMWGTDWTRTIGMLTYEQGVAPFRDTKACPRATRRRSWEERCSKSTSGEEQMNRLAGKVAVITGGGSGIGRAAAKLFVAEGAKVVVAEIDAALGEASAREAGASARFVKTDVTDEESVKQMVQQAKDAFGHVDVLLNCAGGSLREDKPVTEVDPSVWDKTINLDMKGPFLCCRHVIPVMLERGKGSVVNFSSVVALRGNHIAHVYVMAKGGLISFTQALAGAYSPKGIRVNAICPGVVLTERVRSRFTDGNQIRFGGIDNIAGQYPFAVGQPEDIANVALFLASDESRMVNGAAIPAEGGFSAY